MLYYAHMAESHSPVGSRPLQRTPVRQSLHLKEKILFARQSWDHSETEVPPDSQFFSGIGVKQHKQHGSTSSDKSTNASRDSSVTSKTGYRTSMEVGPLFDEIPKSARNILPSDSLLQMSPITLDAELNTAREASNMINPHEANTLEEEIQRPASPREVLSSFQAVRSSHIKSVYSGPLERFLAQDDGPIDFSGDREEGWGRLRALRAKVLLRRSQVRNMRKKLHAKELAKSAADEAFLKFVRLRGSKASLQSEDIPPDIEEGLSLDDLHAVLQQARDEFGPLNDDYNNLEDLLDQEEFEMAEIEGWLFNSRNKETPSSEPALLGLSSRPHREFPPLQVRFLSTLGDLDLAKERYQNMVLERERLLYLRESRIRVSMNLPENEQHFLNEFPGQAARLLEDIAKVEESVEQQRQDCLEAGIDLAESSLGDFEDSTDELDPSENHSSEITVDPCTFSLLLPKSVEDKVKLGILLTDFDETNKCDRINRWIRYQLQNSPLEVELLIRVFLCLFNIVDLRHWQKGLFQWQFCVLSSWEHDDANQPPAIFEKSNTLSSVTERTIAAVEESTQVVDQINSILPSTPKSLRRGKSAPGSIDLQKISKKEQYQGPVVWYNFE